MRPFRRTAKTREEVSGRPEGIGTPLEVSSCDYRRFGDDRALLSVELQVGGRPCAEIRLRSHASDEVHELAPVAVTFLPESESVRLLFVVARSGPSVDHERLELAVDDDPALALPAPSELPALGTAGCDLDHAVAATLTGEQLQGVAAMLERRCATAERALEDLRVEAPEARKLAQAYRETWELRALLDDREVVYAESNAVVESADAARRDAESATEAVRTELDEARAERDSIQKDLLEELELRGDAIARLEAEVVESGAAIEAWAVEAERARAQLSEAVAGAAALEVERDEARSAVDRLEIDVANVRRDAEAATAEVDAVGERLADTLARAARLEVERDEARGAVDRLEIELANVRRDAEAATADVDAAGERLADARARVARLEEHLDESRASATAIGEELAASQSLVAETEAMLERERNLYEARIASGVESERKLRGRVDELETRLGAERSARGALKRRKDSMAKSFADAQRSRLREATLEEQRTQVAALERQLEQIKQRSAEPVAGDASTPAA